MSNTNRLATRNRIAWIKLTIAEPFPVMWSHVNFDPAHPGACYAAGSSWYHHPNDRDFAERQAAYLNSCGFTVTLDTEIG